MKKFFNLVLVLLIVFSIVGCSNISDSKGTVTVVINSTEQQVYSVDIEKVEITEGVFSLLKYLRENQGLNLKYNDSGYGAYLTEIGNCKVVESNQFISVWTSLENDFDVSGYQTTREYNGVCLTSSGLGVSSMSVVDGLIVLFEVSSF